MTGQHKTRLPLHVRTIWISDVHLGSPGCSAHFLLRFLRSVHCERLYLVGDIIDFWSLRKRFYWPQAHNDVIRTILGMARHGTRVVYVPGNHDELLRDHHGLTLGNIELRNQALHHTADGRTLLVLHGDEFDSVVKCSPLLALIGTRLYQRLLTLNRLVNWIRRRLGFPYWSLAAYLKHKVKNAVQYIGNFTEAVAHEASIRQVDGLVCGHIHRAEIGQFNGVSYFNCGDWVESCTALVEHPDGHIELLHWSDHREVLDDERPVHRAA